MDQATVLADLTNHISSLLIMGFDGVNLKESQSLGVLSQTPTLGGVVAFDCDYEYLLKHHIKREKNIQSPKQTAALNASLSHVFPLGYRSIDVEGGLDWVESDGVRQRFGVNRLMPGYGFAKTKDAKTLGDLYEKGQLAQVEQHCDELASLLCDAGFNCVYAPVVDLNVNPTCPIIGAMRRSYSDQLSVVVGCASMMIAACAQRGIQTVLKHYPGHGSAVGDTHLGCVDVTDTWHEHELAPFHQLANQCGMVMMSHVIARQVDDKPVSLSATWVSRLRARGFDGVIITDDIQMDGVYSTGVGEDTLAVLSDVILKALCAGNDMVIIGQQQHALPIAQWPQLLKSLESAVLSGCWPIESVLTSLERVSRLKQKPSVADRAASQ